MRSRPLIRATSSRDRFRNMSTSGSFVDLDGRTASFTLRALVSKSHTAEV